MPHPVVVPPAAFLQGATTAASIPRYAEYLRTGDDTILSTAFTADHLDHVSGQRGVEIMRLVRKWLDESFADVTHEVHAVTTGSDIVSLWFSSTARHVGSAFPPLGGRAATGRIVVAEAVHMFRVVDGRLAEHWAVRDDLGVLRQLDAPEQQPIQRDRPRFSA
ncbi:ester cyclase [Pseudonocardia sp. TRM90224]|uniref:ester cyclase n=1 Tax=Pseudonocardia sp. TRM90224 TaxID=2812678 RepID=UPI001E65BB97|nr:ester cyclase [Pseudonocardia sp. TRM90224]